MKTKTNVCTKCATEKIVSEFYFRSDSNAYTKKCKECIKDERKDFRKSDQYKEYSSVYYKTDKVKKLKKAIRHKRVANGKSKAYDSKRYKTDIQFKLRKCLRARLNSFFRKGFKSISAIQDLGCSIEEFKNYIENKFTEGMNWDNYGRDIGKWNIDHIKPLSKFDLNNIEDMKKAVHYTNMQPLWSSDNYSKRDKYHEDK